MLITIQSNERTHLASLSDEAHGVHWIQDADGARIVFAEAVEAGWSLAPAEGLAFSGAPLEERLIVPFGESMRFSVEGEGGRWTLLGRPSLEGDKTTRIIGFSQEMRLSIGRTADNTIRYPSPFVSSHHAELLFQGGVFSLIDTGSSNGVFLNGYRLQQHIPTHLQSGDVITLWGLRITIGQRLISLNDPEDSVDVEEGPGMVPFEPPLAMPDRHRSVPQKDHFYPALRFVRSIEPKRFTLCAPPQPEPEDSTPIGLRLGPSLVMALASVLSASVSASLICEQGGSPLRALPLFVMAVAMLAGSILWPFLNRRYQRKQRQRGEMQRRSAYSQYLGKVRSELQRESQLQKDILHENRLSPQACLEVASKQDQRFLSRTPLHGDHLEVRIGHGELPLEADLRFPEIGFSLQEDDLQDAVKAFAHEAHVLDDVPLAHSLIANPVIGIVGSLSFTDGFLRNILIQLCALHSYRDVKVVILADRATAPSWAFARYIPHLFSDDKDVRFFSSSLEEANALGMLLGKLLEERPSTEGFDAREAKPYVILLCPSKALYDRAQIVKDILAGKENKGFTVIACGRHCHELPPQCRTIIEEGEGGAYLLDRDDPIGTRKPFTPDPPISLDQARAFALDVAKARLDVPGAAEQLPAKLSFLQMLGVANVDHLNVADRWRRSNASNALACPLGVDAAGDPFMLDLHEDAHGPHGLIAGTTGSGKSELIITYVLSMALTYSPDEVAFVLIDYKGGGLAKAFDNDRFKLPHVAGTVTNLDGPAIARSLASLQSELRRRQRLFNEAREMIGGDTVDIYRYLDLFRQGRVPEPCPHLIVIADEFAELKQQEPGFMDELISASRIGRSLGVHLLLATQKPSGVVNEQIWSNARFKIALKVADAADSQEVIRRPDAAGITHPGRFFLAVGYNELFCQGQSAYSGALYEADQDPCAPHDQGVSYISSTGRTLLSVKLPSEHAGRSSVPQLVAIAEHLVQVAAAQGVCAQPLWLPPLPSPISLTEIGQRFPQARVDGLSLEPVIGVYDDPTHQSQGALTLPLMEEGNALIYGGVDAGVEQILRALLFSALGQHSAQTLHVYLLDLGSQSLLAFAGAPHVGDVMTLEDEEKIKRFFGVMQGLIVERRSRFAPYGGSFARYCEKAEGCPAILVVINGLAAFSDAFPGLEEELIGLVRGSAQVGIFIVAVGEAPGSVRMRLKSYFRQVIACNLPDASDLVMLFGSLQGAPQPHGYGRGLAKVHDVLCEFQAASLCSEAESEYDAIVRACAVWAQGQESAVPSIPVPPDRVTLGMLLGAQVRPGEEPYGLFYATLGWATFDFKETPLARVVSLKAKASASFIAGLVEAWVQRSSRDIVLLDLAQSLDAQPHGCAFSTQKDEFALSYLTSLIQGGLRKPTVILISNIMGFLGRCSQEAASACKAFLKGLVPGGTVAVILFDAAHDASYGYEDWFKAHLTLREGVWIGPGIEGQNAISISYDRSLLPDSKMGAGRGYLVEGGSCRLVQGVIASEERSAD